MKWNGRKGVDFGGRSVPGVAQALGDHPGGKSLCGFAPAFDGLALIALQPGVAGAQQFGGFGDLVLEFAELGVQVCNRCLDILAQAFKLAGFEGLGFEGVLTVGVVEVLLMEIMSGFGE